VVTEFKDLIRTRIQSDTHGSRGSRYGYRSMFEPSATRLTVTVVDLCNL
jgi:hypothetical protein